MAVQATNKNSKRKRAATDVDQEPDPNPTLGPAPTQPTSLAALASQQAQSQAPITKAPPKKRAKKDGGAEKGPVVQKTKKSKKETDKTAAPAGSQLADGEKQTPKRRPAKKSAPTPQKSQVSKATAVVPAGVINPALLGQGDDMPDANSEDTVAAPIAKPAAKKPAKTAPKKAKEPAKAAPKSGKKYKPKPVNEEVKYIIGIRDNIGDDADKSIERKRPWEVVKKMYNAKFNQNVQLGAVRTRYNRKHEEYLGSDPEYKKEYIERWGEPKPPTRRNKKTDDTLEFDDEDLAIAAEEQTGEQTFAGPSNPAPLSDANESDPGVASASAQPPEETNNRVSEGSSENYARYWLNQLGETVAFNLEDEWERELHRGELLIVNRDALIAASVTFQEMIADNPKENLVEVAPYISYATVRRYIQCISPARKDLPTHNVIENEYTKVAAYQLYVRVLGSVTQQKLEWTYDDLFELYQFARDMGTPAVCDMVTDYIYWMFTEQKKLQTPWNNTSQAVASIETSGKYPRLASVEASKQSLNVLGFDPESLNHVADEDPNAPVLTLFGDITATRSEIGSTISDEQALEKLSTRCREIFTECANSKAASCPHNVPQTEYCAQYHMHRADTICCQNAEGTEPEQMSTRLYQAVNADAEKKLAKMKKRVIRAEKGVKDAQVPSDDSSLQSLIAAHSKVQSLYDWMEEDTPMVDSGEEEL